MLGLTTLGTCWSGRVDKKCKAGKIIFLYYSYTIYSATQTAAILKGDVLAFA